MKNTDKAENNPNVNYGMYEADRVAKEKAQPKLPAETDLGNAPSEQGMLSRTIQTNNRSGTFSAKADYVPTSDGRVRIYDWIFDTLGIVPSGTEMRLLGLEEAQSEFRERMANGWTF